MGWDHKIKPSWRINPWDPSLRIQAPPDRIGLKVFNPIPRIRILGVIPFLGHTWILRKYAFSTFYCKYSNPKRCYKYMIIYVPLCLYPLLPGKYSSPIRCWEYSLQPDIANQERHRNVDQPIDAAGPSSGGKLTGKNGNQHRCDDMETWGALTLEKQGHIWIY